MNGPAAAVPVGPVLAGAHERWKKCLYEILTQVHHRLPGLTLYSRFLITRTAGHLYNHQHVRISELVQISEKPFKSCCGT